MKSIIFLLWVLILVNGSPLSLIVERFQPAKSDKLQEVFPDYSDLSFEEINIETNEISLSLDEWYSNIYDCIKKCQEMNPNETYKSNCVQKICEFY